MSRIAYVNGSYLPQAHASVHIEDRGYQFADGIYEVIAVWNGLPVDYARHLERLKAGLEALSIALPMPERSLMTVLRQVIRRNGLKKGALYLQVTRGVAPRNHPFPAGIASSLVVTARSKIGPAEPALSTGVDVLSVADIRWKRRDIKTIGLLPNVLAKQAARQAGAFEAWMVGPHGWVTEGSSSNAWMVDRNGNLVTRPSGCDILSGVTRLTVMDLAGKAGLTVIEHPFTLKDAKAGSECFLTSTTSFVLPVVRVDGAIIGSGRPGPLAQRLLRLYMERLDDLTAETAWS